ncbi:MAG: hypothetical protein Q7S12_02945 [bacterium]|nr:hypothetical protein [bacterium]
MSEKRFRRILTICVLIVLLTVFLLGRIYPIFEYLLLAASAFSAVVIVWAGLKADKTVNEFEKEMAFSKQKIVERNLQLIADLMHQSAKLSDAEEKIKMLTSEVETFLEQSEHNKCWTNEFRLRQVFKITKKSRWPDPQKITLPEMLWACKIYCPEQIKPSSPKEEQMVKEIGEVIKKYMY